jgi:hypothetical protein
LPSMLQIKEVGCATCVIIVEVCEGDDIEVFSGSKIIAKQLREIATTIIGCVWITHISIVKEQFLSVLQVQPAGVSIAKVEEGELVHCGESS